MNFTRFLFFGAAIAASDKNPSFRGKAEEYAFNEIKKDIRHSYDDDLYFNQYKNNEKLMAPFLKTHKKYFFLRSVFESSEPEKDLKKISQERIESKDDDGFFSSVDALIQSKEIKGDEVKSYVEREYKNNF